MLQKMIATVRGFNQWLPATATVTSRESDVDGKNGAEPFWITVGFCYRDQSNALQSGYVGVNSAAEFYNLNEGDTFDIRYNPKIPSEYECSAVASAATQFKRKIWGFIALAGLLTNVLLHILRHR